MTVMEAMVPSMSAPPRLTSIVVSSLPAAVPGVALGASLTEATLIVSVAGNEVAPSLSVTVKLKLVLPLKSVVGTNLRAAAWAAVSAVPATTAVTPSARNSVPLAGKAVTVTNVIVPSISVPPRLTAMVVSSFPLAAPGVALGASFTEVTLIVSVAGNEMAHSLSVTVKSKLVLPLKLVVGTNVKPAASVGVSAVPATTGVVPSARNSVPSVGRAVTVTDAIVPSMSVPPRLMAMVVSSLPATVPGVALGASFTETTLIVSVAGSEVAPSLSVKLKGGTNFKLAASAAVRAVPATTGVVPSFKNSVPLAGKAVTVTEAIVPSMSAPPRLTSIVVSSLP